MTERRQMRLPRASGGVLFRFETRRGAESIFDDIGFHYGMIAKGNRRGASMTELELLESINIPEYFVTHVGQTECAGGGNVRIYNCVKRGRFLVPQCTVVIPAVNLIVAARRVEDAAREVFNMEKMTGAVAH